MNDAFKNIPEDMKALGLGALAHANRHAAYYDELNDSWSQLSVLQAAHSAEILIKARIAEEHPLLLFETFPEVKDTQMSLDDLLTNGHTIEWSQLYSRLWATTGIKIPNKKTFVEFGKLRNGLQHFGITPTNISPALKTLEFIYQVIDPFINNCWGLYAIDFDEDYDSYENLLPVLLNYEIQFQVSPDAAECSEYWTSNLADCSVEYQHIMQKRIDNAKNDS